MKFGLISPNSVFSIHFFQDKLIEIHAQAPAHAGGIRYLVKKHKQIGEQPYGTLGKTAFTTMTGTPREYYVENNKDFLWIMENYLKFIAVDSNRDMKSALQKFEE